MGGRPVAGRRASRPYKIRLHPDAAKTYGRLQGQIRDRIMAAIDALSDVPRPAGAIKLAGSHDFRVRVGDYRIVYAVDDGAQLVIAARIGHRREVYRR